MQWKDVLIGAISTLAVTVVGGVAVYYATKEPEFKARELLTYSVRSSGDFSGEKERVAFTSVVIANRGGRAATNVVASIKFATPSIKDLATETVLGANEERAITSEQATLSYLKLLPGESITVNLLLSSPAQPVVTVRSDESLAVNEASLGTEKRERRTELNRASSLVVPISAFLFIVLTALFSRKAKRLGIADSMLSDRNNAAFLLLHSGLPKEAEDILTASLQSGRYDSFTLSNLALSKAVNGDPEKAAALMHAATYRETKGHAAAVVLFNEALLNFTSGKRSEAIAALRKALVLSPRQVKKYCDRSIHLNNYRADPDFISLVGGA
ncbi:hypothetical protein [Luteimonas sp. MC1828]|uniref:tetratricopeptide repeat protein n=1 Tax=Luteimonas sp. MC1828 TaxID=2799787 RepID=UPI0018F1FC7D|nr:hypothetical protein [Luteimonas sp. MC1828]MBJ7575255.1 hypothetical protein [Luteimonas sp. MC1828]